MPRAQTTKQAKAAYKARGQTISESEKRRLARGAELLARADRLREQERRRKDVLEKKKDNEAKSKNDSPGPLLGTQRQLDKFGYKSSQFHLGAFVKPISLKRSSDSGVGLAEPWEDEEDDLDDSLLAETGQDLLDPVVHNAQRVGEVAKQPESYSCSDLDDFLDSSTQLALELCKEDSPPTIRREQPSKAQWTSFSSDDFGMTEDDWQQIEKKLDQMPAPGQQRQLAPSICAKNRDEDDRRAMPPPPPNLPLTTKDNKSDHVYRSVSSDQQNHTTATKTLMPPPQRPPLARQGLPEKQSRQTTINGTRNPINVIDSAHSKPTSRAPTVMAPPPAPSRPASFSGSTACSTKLLTTTAPFHGLSEDDLEALANVDDMLLSQF